jgi:hypothetical protein
MLVVIGSIAIPVVVVLFVLAVSLVVDEKFLLP